MNKTRKKPLTVLTIFTWLCFGLYLPFYGLGYTFYLLSKVMRFVGLLALLKPHTAKDALAGFWNIQIHIGDIKNIRYGR